jgi:hypothetical protein
LEAEKAKEEEEEEDMWDFPPPKNPKKWTF